MRRATSRFNSILVLCAIFALILCAAHGQTLTLTVEPSNPTPGQSIIFTIQTSFMIPPETVAKINMPTTVQIGADSPLIPSQKFCYFGPSVDSLPGIYPSASQLANAKIASSLIPSYSTQDSYLLFTISNTIPANSYIECYSRISASVLADFTHNVSVFAQIGNWVSNPVSFNITPLPALFFTSFVAPTYTQAAPVQYSTQLATQKLHIPLKFVQYKFSYTSQPLPSNSIIGPFTIAVVYTTVGKSVPIALDLTHTHILDLWTDTSTFSPTSSHKLTTFGSNQVRLFPMLSGNEMVLMLMTGPDPTTSGTIELPVSPQVVRIAEILGYFREPRDGVNIELVDQIESIHFVLKYSPISNPSQNVTSTVQLGANLIEPLPEELFQPFTSLKYSAESYEMTISSLIDPELAETRSDMGFELVDDGSQRFANMEPSIVGDFQWSDIDGASQTLFSIQGAHRSPPSLHFVQRNPTGHIEQQQQHQNPINNVLSTTPQLSQTSLITNATQPHTYQQPSFKSSSTHKFTPSSIFSSQQVIAPILDFEYIHSQSLFSCRITTSLEAVIIQLWDQSRTADLFDDCAATAAVDGGFTFNCQLPQLPDTIYDLEVWDSTLSTKLDSATFYYSDLNGVPPFGVELEEGTSSTEISGKAELGTLISIQIVGGDTSEQLPPQRITDSDVGFSFTFNQLDIESFTIVAKHPNCTPDISLCDGVTRHYTLSLQQEPTEIGFRSDSALVGVFPVPPLVDYEVMLVYSTMVNGVKVLKQLTNSFGLMGKFDLLLNAAVGDPDQITGVRWYYSITDMRSLQVLYANSAPIPEKPIPIDNCQYYSYPGAPEDFRTLKCQGFAGYAVFLTTDSARDTNFKLEPSLVPTGLFTIRIYSTTPTWIEYKQGPGKNAQSNARLSISQDFFPNTNFPFIVDMSWSNSYVQADIANLELLNIPVTFVFQTGKEQGDIEVTGLNLPLSTTAYPGPSRLRLSAVLCTGVIKFVHRIDVNTTEEQLFRAPCSILNFPDYVIADNADSIQVFAFGATSLRIEYIFAGESRQDCSYTFPTTPSSGEYTVPLCRPLNPGEFLRVWTSDVHGFESYDTVNIYPASSPSSPPTQIRFSPTLSSLDGNCPPNSTVKLYNSNKTFLTQVNASGGSFTFATGGASLPCTGVQCLDGNKYYITCEQSHFTPSLINDGIFWAPNAVDAPSVLIYNEGKTVNFRPMPYDTDDAPTTTGKVSLYLSLRDGSNPTSLTFTDNTELPIITSVPTNSIPPNTEVNYFLQYPSETDSQPFYHNTSQYSFVSPFATTAQPPSPNISSSTYSSTVSVVFDAEMNTSKHTHSTYDVKFLGQDLTVTELPLDSLLELYGITSTSKETANSLFTIDVNDATAKIGFKIGIASTYTDTITFPQQELFQTLYFSIQPHQIFGEIFHDDFPFPVCTIDKPQIYITPHNVAPVGFDVHSFGRWVKIEGIFALTDFDTIECTIHLNSDRKLALTDTLNVAWQLMFLNREMNIGKQFEITPTYSGDTWAPLATTQVISALIVQGPGFTENQLPALIDGIVDVINTSTPAPNPPLQASDLTFTSLIPAQPSFAFKYNHSLRTSAGTFNFFGLSHSVFDESGPNNQFHSYIYPSSLLVFGLPSSWQLNPQRLIYQPIPAVDAFPFLIQVVPDLSGLNMFQTNVVTNPPFAQTEFPPFSASGKTCRTTNDCNRLDVDLNTVRWSPPSVQQTPPSAPPSAETVSDNLTVCYQSKCTGALDVPRGALEEFILLQRYPTILQPSAITARITTNSNPAILSSANLFTYGYNFGTRPVTQLHAGSTISGSIAWSQGFKIDKSNPEYNSILKDSFTLELLSYPVRSNGEIISPTNYRKLWSSSSPQPMTTSAFTIPTQSMSGSGSRYITIRATSITDSAVSVESTPFTSMAACMSPPTDTTSFNDPAAWADTCAPHGRCQSNGLCRCSDGYHGSKCTIPPTTTPTSPTGCQDPANACVHGSCDAISHTCQCAATWEGDRCQTKSECMTIGREACSNNGHALTDESGTCQQIGCECENFWTGSTCNRCGLECRNGGRALKTCISPCGCPAGFAGNLCQCFQRQGSFTIAMNNELVQYVNQVRAEYAAQSNIPSSAVQSIDLDLLNLPYDTIDQYLTIADAIAQDALNGLKLSTQTTATVKATFDSHESTFIHPDKTTESYMQTKFIYTFTYNCDSTNAIDLTTEWTNFLSTIPDEVINQYFTPTRPDPKPEEPTLVETDPTLTPDHTIQPDVESGNSATQLILSVTLALILAHLL